MDNNVHLGDGVLDEAKSTINSELKELLNTLIVDFFDWFKRNKNDIPEAVKRLLDSPEAKQEIVSLWSERLFEKGLVPKGYKGLPDDLLISNFHQTGYLDGLFVGYTLAMMALVDNNAPKEMIIAVRDYIRPNLLGHYYGNKDEFIGPYKENERYTWIEKA